MKLNNRFIFGILSLLLAAVIAFVALPTIARQTNGKEEIVRITQPVLKGEQISSENAEVVEVGGYMPRPGYLLRMILPVKTQCRRHRRVMEVILLKQKQIKCPYCHAHASLRPASLVYGSTPQTRGKFLYVCDRWPACNAYVSAHERTLLPMGTLANGDLRHKRILAHRALKKLQQDCHMEKWEVYIWLQAKLGLDAHQTHIGQFSEYMCEQVISLCQQAPAYTSGRAA